MEKGKVRLYEWVRIFATLMVVLGHASYLTMATSWGGVAYPDPPLNAHAIYALLYKVFYKLGGWVYAFHMPLFFLLSGAVLHLKPPGRLDSFIGKKFRRLIVPYFTVGLFYMFPIKLAGGFYDMQTVIKAISSYLSAQSESGHLWFLPSLFWCMVMLALLLKFLERMNCHSMWAIFIASLLLKDLIPRMPFAFSDLQTAAGYFAWFALGYCLDELCGWLDRQGMCRLWVLLLITLGLWLCQEWNWEIWPPYIKILLGCAGTLLFAQICTKTAGRLESAKLYRLLTRNLFNIYLFHDPLNYLILRVFINNGWLRYGGMCIVYFLARTVGVIMISIALGEGCGRLWTVLKQAGTGKSQKGAVLNG